MTLRACSACPVSRLQAPSTALPVEARTPATASALVDPNRLVTQVSRPAWPWFAITGRYQIRQNPLSPVVGWVTRVKLVARAGEAGPAAHHYNDVGSV